MSPTMFRFMFGLQLDVMLILSSMLLLYQIVKQIGIHFKIMSFDLGVFGIGSS